MKKNANKNNFKHAGLMAMLLVLAACERTNEPAVAAALPESVHAELIDTAIERRHFAIYNASRVLFDDSPQVFQSRARAQDEGLQQALLLAESVPACSMRGMLLQD
ncbi:hypothetical protein [Noviherbaspirillum sp.]|uniref:hypothetical protein n=1 Tax=Noviherbaspirillum sp. TaxID=1926288 RepID=UPI002D30E5C4|nr:hypothetical protein [Noviherbaspirillum sp.]HZW23506.1 hypothetical protein [Noviherbaspirillum sp.]